jgi:hypothetical protein
VEPHTPNPSLDPTQQQSSMVFRFQVEVSFNINLDFLDFYLFCSLIFVNTARRGSTYQSAGSKVLCQRMPLWLQLEIAFHLQERELLLQQKEEAREEVEEEEGQVHQKTLKQQNKEAEEE